MAGPKLTFFCELDPAPLHMLFADGALISHLQALDATVSMGIKDLSAERATVVRQLNAAGIPLVAWLLLPEAEGYWFNLDNATQALQRYEAFTTWTATHGLQWQRVGLDIEPDIKSVTALMGGEMRVLPRLFLQLRNGQRYHAGVARYTTLVERVRADGYPVDSYQFPVIVDERQLGSTLLQRVFGLVDVPVDREVLMLYSSFLRPNGQGMLWSYAPDAMSIAVGSTGGGVTYPGIQRSVALSWAEFSRDLLLAKRWSDDIHIFSLEGCDRQDFLARLCDFDWESSISPPLEAFQKFERFRQALRAVLWASAHPGVVLFGVGAILWLSSALRRKRRTRS